MRIYLIILFFPLLLFSQIKATPIADGFGKFTTGGSGGDVYHVTNLNDSGAGSLRYGVDRGDGYSGPRTIVFDVGGDIDITGIGIIVSAGLDGDLTIAGETAPSPGITIRGDASSDGAGSLFEIRDSNVIIRYITIRVNDGNATDQDCLRINNTSLTGGLSNIFIDHVTLSNGSDEVFSLDGSPTTIVEDVTVQNSMMGNSDTPYNFLMGSDVFNLSFIRNFLHHEDYRNPLYAYGSNGESLEHINNVHFGATTGFTEVVYGHNADVIGNVYRGWNDYVFGGRAVNWVANGINNPDGVITDGSFYFATILYKNPSQFTYTTIQPSDLSVMSGSRVITGSLITSWETTISGIEDVVFNTGYGVGNSIYRDAMDTEAISDYFNGSNQRNLNSFIPEKSSTSRPGSDDSDGDNLLDVAEIAIWGNITTTNASGNFTDTSVVDVNAQSINAYNNLRKTHFYLAGDLSVSGSGGGGTSEGVTSTSGRITGDAVLIAN